MLTLIKKIKQVKRTEHYNRAQVLEHQQTQFRKLLHHVIRHSSFYQTYYKSYGIEARHIDTISLKDIPFITKQLMMENYDNFVCDKRLKRKEIERFIQSEDSTKRYYLNKYQIIHTAGSTGRLGIFAYGPADWKHLMALAITRISKSNLRPFKKLKIAFVGAINGNYAGVSLARSAPSLFFDILPISINAPMQEIVARLNTFQPDVLNGYASSIYLLALEQSKGNLKIKIEKSVCSGDALTSHMKYQIQEAFNIQPTNLYAASESVGMAIECLQHNGLHLFHDWHCFEFLDQNNQEIKPGETGRLVLTNLYNFTQPLIRYQTNDYMTLGNMPCDCGWEFPKIQIISGRAEEFLWFENASGAKEFIHPLQIVELFAAGLEKFQIVQPTRNSLQINAVIKGDPVPCVAELQHKMQAILKEKNLEKLVSITIHPQTNIEVDKKSGKFKLIIPFEYR